MRLKNRLKTPLWKRGGGGILLLAVGTSLSILLASGCASSPSTIKQPPPTSYTRSTVGTPNELSPQAPGEAQNIRKVGDHWVCEVHGKTMVYNNATSCWEPQQK
jgi:hypothetical protein